MDLSLFLSLSNYVCFAWTDGGMHHSPYLHVANILYLASYSVRDILWLRILTVLAMLSLGYCYTCHGEFGALIWQAIFLAINVIQIAILLLERRPVKLTEDQKKMHEGPLHSLTARQVQRFTAKADWCTYQPGEVLLHENSSIEHLILVLSGRAKVIAGGEHIANLGEGQFAGEMSFLAGGLTTAEVIADGTLLVARWSEKYISEVMHKDQELGRALQSSLGSDVVRKLIKSREQDLSHG